MWGSFQATSSNTLSLTDRYSYLSPLKAQLPSSKQHSATSTPASKTISTISTVSITPAKLQRSSLARKSFSPDKSLQGTSTSKACSSAPAKPQPVESSYYHEVDSDFLDFDPWSPDMPVSMLTPPSPPDHDKQMSHSRTSMQPQSSSAYRKETPKVIQPIVKNIPLIKTVNNNNKQFANDPKQTNTKVKETPTVLPRNGPCSFFTAGSTK